MRLTMHSKFKIVLVAVTIFSFIPYTSADNEKSVKDDGEKYAASSLCDMEDIIFFSCSTQNNKIISLCGRKTTMETVGVFYRFGKKEKIEMDFPKNKSGSSFLLFSYDNYFRYKVSLLNVYFENNGYSYTLYDNYRGDDPDVGEQRESGISVTSVASDKVIANIKCKSEIITNFDFLLKKIKISANN